MNVFGFKPAAKFTVSAWGDKVNSGIGLSHRPPGYIGWRAGTTTQCLSQLYPPVRGLGIWLLKTAELSVTMAQAGSASGPIEKN
jgi:hypothetical protein